MTDWTAPRSWTIGEIVTKAILDAHIRDNELFLIENPPVNLLTNGGFEIWQRGAGAFSANNAYLADRWQIAIAGTSTFSVTRDTTQKDTDSQYGALVQYTHNAASYLSQRIEDFNQLRGRRVSASVRVKTATASAVRLRIVDSTGNGSYSSYHTGGGAYETLRVENLLIAAGATYVDVRIYFEATVVNLGLDNAIAVIGPEAPDYQPLHPADDLARCLRYYEIHGAVSQALRCSGYNTAGEAIGQGIVFMAQKGGAPTVTKNGTWPATNCGQPTIVGGNVAGYSLRSLVTLTAAAEFYPAVAGDTVTAEYNP